VDAAWTLKCSNHKEQLLYFVCFFKISRILSPKHEEHEEAPVLKVAHVTVCMRTSPNRIEFADFCTPFRSEDQTEIAPRVGLAMTNGMRSSVVRASLAIPENGSMHLQCRSYIKVIVGRV
jgi:hypothetical protein